MSLSIVTRGLLRAAATLVLLSLAVGGLSAFALSGQTTAFDGRTMLGAHVTGLIGAALLFGFAISLPHLKYPLQRSALLGRVFVAANFANVVIGTGKAFFFVHGLGVGGSTANTVAFLLLNAFVVLPSFAVALLWSIGFLPTDAA